MRYTLLSSRPQGIVLCQYHLRRLGLSEPDSRHAGGRSARAVLSGWCRDQDAGTWAVTIDDAGELKIEARPETSLRDGMPVRFEPTPMRNLRGAIPKPPSPSPYDAVRLKSRATLLTSVDGTEIYEACRAAVLGWDGERVVCVPRDRPRVWSTSEAAVREHLLVRETPIAVDSAMPILLVNAVKGPCTLDLPTRRPFPEPVRKRIERLFDELTHYPTHGDL